ncbi:lysine--tRNA ligase [Brachybacterium saurashtrense]|uniref:Lysine--tRNA ligase n=1 Tax=Brachybacterium saurashtrense TaxID=556288 RepID=A0A345YLM1_9MICO|nr:lysine--tRNA ligase [Brachybacterium saurashtrense]AXK44823.1 lysine--tRNA ligase [Brachybacterium saurashtrense]RRR20799.1 lysine--tRNA ligase [Brachybacterium saurashtrense]
MSENPPAPDTTDTSDQVAVRKSKRERLLARGEEAYPVSVPVTTTIAAVRDAYGHLEAGEETDDEVGIAGRVVFQRNTGKLAFVTVQDGAGRRLQIMASQKVIGEERLAALKADVDLGDHVFFHGRVGASRRGELSVFADSWQMAAKAVRPLPVLHAELSEESRVRHRYVDLIVRQEARDTVRRRAEVMHSLRTSFHERDFVEIETPMLQVVPSGAAARPFVTHMNAFDLDLYLRIAPELFLKRAAVGGLEKVFEINRNFRNEGADSTHSPEFAMLEAYEAYGDYDTIGDLTRRLVQEAAERATGSQIVTLADGTEYDFSGEWAKITVYGSLSESLGEEITPETSPDHLRAIARSLDLDLDHPKFGHGKLVEELFEHRVGDHLHEPTFVRDFPVETSPLVRAHRTQPGVVEKWDLYVRGFELGTGYSELVDPVIQRERFAQQARLAAQGDDEAMRMDEDFLEAMEYALPPTGGMGMGMDRLLMALTGLGIRETILFPLVKPEA